MAEAASQPESQRTSVSSHPGLPQPPPPPPPAPPQVPVCHAAFSRTTILFPEAASARSGDEGSDGDDEDHANMLRCSKTTIATTLSADRPSPASRPPSFNSSRMHQLMRGETGPVILRPDLLAAPQLPGSSFLAASQLPGSSLLSSSPIDAGASSSSGRRRRMSIPSSPIVDPAIAFGNSVYATLAGGMGSSSGVGVGGVQAMLREAGGSGGSSGTGRPFGGAFDSSSAILDSLYAAERSPPREGERRSRSASHVAFPEHPGNPVVDPGSIAHSLGANNSPIRTSGFLATWAGLSPPAGPLAGPPAAPRPNLPPPGPSYTPSPVKSGRERSKMAPAEGIYDSVDALAVGVARPNIARSASRGDFAPHHHAVSSRDGSTSARGIGQSPRSSWHLQSGGSRSNGKSAGLDTSVLDANLRAKAVALMHQTDGLELGGKVAEARTSLDKQQQQRRSQEDVSVMQLTKSPIDQVRGLA